MLTPVKTYQEVAEVVNTLLLQGGVTNGLPDRDAMEREIRQGTLFLQEEGRGLLLVRRREQWDRLTFFLRKGQTLRGWQPERSTLAELPFRRATDPIGEVAASLEGIGFRQILTRVRYTRRGREDGSLPQETSLAWEGSYELLCSSFPAMTGCLPGREEWSALCNAGQVLTVPGGVLHYEQKGKTSELRHLAVAAECRRQGIGRTLVGAYLRRCGAGLCRVWTGEDNVSAQRLYESFGYEKDGWTSRVYYFDRTEKEE